MHVFIRRIVPLRRRFPPFTYEVTAEPSICEQQGHVSFDVKHVDARQQNSKVFITIASCSGTYDRVSLYS